MGKIFKKIATGILLAICAILVLRCCMAADKSVFEELYGTETLLSAASDGEVEIKTVAVKRELSEDGYFAAYGFYYCPETGEVQLAVRWNDSVYEYTDMAEGHEYSFYLLIDETGEKYPLSCLDSKKRAIYNYRKLAAEGVPLNEEQTLTVVMELRDGFESTQVIVFAEQPILDYKLSGADKKMLFGK